MSTIKGSLYQGLAFTLILAIFLMSCTFFQGQRDVLPKAPKQKVVKKEGKKAEFIPVDIDKQIMFSTGSQEPEDYQLGIDDIVEVSVYAEPGLSTKQSVRPDGKISLPLIGDITAGGRTPIELRDEIAKKLAKYVVNPRVTVLILEYRSKKAMILGEVEAPGLLRLSANIPLLEAVSLAGGVTRNADLRGTILIRDGRIVPINFYRLLKQGDMRQNIILQSNDVILVPSNEDNKVYVLGEVNRRGIIRITDQLSILEAITAAGGITKAGKHKVILVRGGLGDPHMLEVDIDKITKKGDLSKNIYLARGDIVYVPTTLMTHINTVMAYINTFLTTAVLLESGITLYPDVRSVLTKGRLSDIETESTSVTRDPLGNIIETGTSTSKTRRK